MGKTPHLTVRCEYPDTGMAPTEVTFGVSPRYGIHTGREAHEWFPMMMRNCEEFGVETDEPGELPLSFWSETVRGGDGGVEPFPLRNLHPSTT